MSAEWENFLRNWHGSSRYVCALAAYLDGYLKASSTDVRIDHAYALKSIQKHGLAAEHLPLMRKAIRDGEAALDRPRHITFMYRSAEFERWFQVTVKCCTEKRRLFVTTFHALSPDDVTRRRKRYETVWPIEFKKGR